MRVQYTRVSLRRVLATVLVTLFALVMLPHAGITQTASGETTAGDAILDKIVASVDDEPILLSDLLIDVQAYIQQIGQMPDSTQFMSLLDEALQNRVNEKMLVAKAHRDEIQVGEDELERSMDAHIARLTEQAGGEARFQFELEKEGLTDRELRRKLLPNMRDQMLVQRILERISYEITATEDETRAYYEANKDNRDILPLRPTAVILSHVLFQPQASGPRATEVQALVATAKRRLASGEDFGAIASDISEGPAAARGGDLGWFNLRDIGLQALRAALVDLQVGEIADDVVSEQGHHILEVVERTGGRVHFRQIFFAMTVADTDKLEARARARDAHSRLLAGEDWAAVAKELSDDSMTKDDGGRLPEIAENQLEAQYLGIVQALEPGEMSSVFQSATGYQIIRLESREVERPFGFEEIADQLRTQLINMRRSEMLDQYIEELRGEISIQLHGLPSLDEIAGMGG
ncbi:MAG: hypothetical protein GY835_14005 [bacterium]|nr:hypothetical protein [bacterium]